VPGQRRCVRAAVASAPGLSLEDKRAINKALLNSGAAIDEMNCVRKHLSAIKAGACRPLRAGEGGDAADQRRARRCARGHRQRPHRA